MGLKYFYIFIFYFLCSWRVEAENFGLTYKDPFDLAAGGSVLTRSTQEGSLAANPALLPYGGKFLRWFGLKSSLSVGKDSISLAKNALGKKNQSDLIGKVLVTPVHLGINESLSFISTNFGVSTFLNIEPDIRFWKRGDPDLGAGTPTVLFRNDFSGGALGSLAFQSFWPYLSFGTTAKYLLNSDLEERIDLTNKDGIAALQKKFGSLSASSAFRKGLGFDVGSLLFLKTDFFDMRVATTINDLGNTKLKSSISKKVINQTINLGFGLTFHTNRDAIHLSVDYRDVQNKNQEHLFKRVFVGSRFLIRKYVALAAGVYQGRPSFGAEVDFLIGRFALTSYSREYGNNPGVDTRSIYVLSIFTGFSL